MILIISFLLLLSLYNDLYFLAFTNQTKLHLLADKTQQTTYTNIFSTDYIEKMMIVSARMLASVTRKFPLNIIQPIPISVEPITILFKKQNLSTSLTSLHKYLIPPDDLRITYSSSSGPGGQNVNKLATKVDVR